MASSSEEETLESPSGWRSAYLRLSAPNTLAGYESTRFLGKWLVIAGLISVVAGLGALLFSFAIKVSTEFFLGTIVGYIPTNARWVGEANAGSHGPSLAIARGDGTGWPYLRHHRVPVCARGSKAWYRCRD